MVCLAKKNGRVVAHADVQAMVDMDGVTPEKTVTDAEWEAAEGLVRIIDGQIVLGKTDEEKAVEAETDTLTAEQDELLAELVDKDYKVVKSAEAGQVLAEMDPDLHGRRDWCRDRINAIRARLQELGVE
jgi:hypothetical protein